MLMFIFNNYTKIVKKPNPTPTKIVVRYLITNIFISHYQKFCNKKLLIKAFTKLKFESHKSLDPHEDFIICLK